MDMNKNVRPSLCRALDDLLEDQFKRFKFKLQATEYDGKQTIPKGKLEKADKSDTVDLMCEFYGEDGAVTVCIRILEEIPAKDVAAKLKEAIQKDVGPHPIPVISGYRNHVKIRFQIMKDPNSHLGEYVPLSQRYSKLIIIENHRNEKERKHEIMASGWKHAEIMKKRDSSSITIEELFKPDKYGLTSQVVVLQGAAGIGKTTIARKIMFDWASGQLYGDRFDYVFYINCREMNLFTETSFVDIILKQWPSQHTANNVVKELIKEILRNPQKLLFIVDGFDELRFSFDQPEDCLCTDPWQKKPVGVLLSSLFLKKALPESYLIITTRPTALEKLRQCLECSRYAEILGFSVEEREEFFQKFFENRKQATEAFQIVKQNTTLFTMCVVPLVCWIICTVMKQQMEKEEDLEQGTNTLTSVYVHYLYSLLRFHHGKAKQDMQRNLKSLCGLAADGIWKQKILFGEKEIVKHGLNQEESSLFLNENIFKRDLECVSAYSFIHLSFQEFFAALYYALDEGKGQQRSQRPNPDVRTLLEMCQISRFDLEITVRFLFGLLNESERMKRLKEILGLKISPKLKEILLDWVKNTPNQISIEMQFFQNLYESQDKSLLKASLGAWDRSSLSISPENEMDARAVVYCLQHWHNLKQVSFICFRYPQLLLFNAEENAHVAYLLKALKCLKNLEILNLFEYYLTEASCEDLAQILKENQSLKKLNLSSNKIKDKGVELLCQGLKHPDCKLESIRMEKCSLTEASCWDLAQVFKKSQGLKRLDLSLNEIKDKGMKLLCEGLNHPDCKLESIKMLECSLTAACCGDLAEVLGESRSLKKLDLSRNEIKDKGMELLCQGLKHPDCQLELITMWECSLTAACCGDLAEVLKKSQSLKELNIPFNAIKNKGVELLCEGLKHPDCKLESINLRYCDLTYAFWEIFCAALATNQSLKEIKIAEERVAEVDKIFFRDAFKYQGRKKQYILVNGIKINIGEDNLVQAGIWKCMIV